MQSIEKLESQLGAIDHFEAVAFVKLDCRFTDIRIRSSKSPAFLELYFARPDGSGTIEERFTSLPQLMSRMSELCNDGQFLIDTLGVKTNQRHGARLADTFIDRTDKLFGLTRDACLEALPAGIVFADQMDKFIEVDSEVRQALGSINCLNMSVWLRFGHFYKQVEVTSVQRGEYLHLRLKESPIANRSVYFRAGDIPSLMACLYHWFDDGELMLDTLMVLESEDLSAEKLLDSGHNLHQFIHKMCGEIACLKPPPPIGTDPQAARATVAPTSERIQRHLLECLQSGEAGIRLWNSRPVEEKKLVKFAKLNFSGLNLADLWFSDLRFKQCVFNNACLRNAYAAQSELTGASFVGADLSGCNLGAVKASTADFSRAVLSGGFLNRAILRDALFTDSDLSGCSFVSADIRGADFSECRNSDASNFDSAIYDERTKLPANFQQAALLKWKGTSPDPYKALLKQSSASSAPSDFAGFIAYIQQEFDKKRIDNSLKMLKKETFQLFCEQMDDAVTGVIKSQTDKDLLYACRLGFDGTFSCCTQNLNACGGLRGALCKHILVLIIGLTKAGALTPELAGRSVICSKLEEPRVNHDAMSAVFLKYKGAESGEVDWRPTETIPEDYYSF